MPSSNPKAILVVGGSENQLGNCLQEVFRHGLFRYFNWSMRQLQTCHEALAFLRQNPLPLVISWCEMPDGNWKDLLRQLPSCCPKMKMSAFTKVEMSAFFAAEDLKSCGSPDSSTPSSSGKHALRCGRVKLSAKRSSFDSLKA